ncbi:hypothetical protein J1N35_034879 [Gossypium stocksii]|uniref:Uncharacterized protein n=1 Tax=Gossypium stocksii TaxID=47602 RepID=A0A9D3ZQE9_9ROSI|nr:hypothetical protein J1N35_034879 [Gossypium stocksii]
MESQPNPISYSCMALLGYQQHTSVTGQSSKPVTIAPNVSDGGLLLRWESFGPQELARFKELLEKPVRLKSGWPDSEDMAT